MTTHTVGQQQAIVCQQSSSAKTKLAVRRTENSEPIIFDLRENDDELEDQGIRVIRFYIGDDDDEPQRSRKLRKLTSQMMSPW